MYHTCIPVNWKEIIKPTFFWQWYCYDHTDLLCVGTVCCVLIIVIIISKITTFVLIAEGCRCWQENSGFCCNRGRHYLPASSEEDRCSDSIAWVFLCIQCIIHPMQSHLDFSRSGIAWKWTGAHTCQCFFHFLMTWQMLQFLLNVNSGQPCEVLPNCQIIFHGSFLSPL